MKIGCLLKWSSKYFFGNKSIYYLFDRTFENMLKLVIGEKIIFLSSNSKIKC